MPRNRFQRLSVIWRRRFGPRRDGAALERDALVGHDQRFVDGHLVADAAAGRAGAEGIVEREKARLDFGNCEARDRTGEFRREDDPFRLTLLVLLIRIFHDGDAIREVERRLEGFRQARRNIVAHHDAVHHHVDIVLELLVEHRRLVDGIIFAVDLQALKALLLELGDFLAVFALAPPHHGRQQIETGLRGQFQHPVDHLADGLALDRQAGGGRIGNAHPRPQQAHVVVDLRHGPTVERGLREVVFCSMEMAGESPSIWSTSGFCIISRN